MEQQFSSGASMPSMTAIHFASRGPPRIMKDRLVIIRLIVNQTSLWRQAFSDVNLSTFPFPGIWMVRRTHRTNKPERPWLCFGRVSPTQPGDMITIRERKDRHSFSIAFQCHLASQLRLRPVVLIDTRTNFVVVAQRPIEGDHTLI